LVVTEDANMPATQVLWSRTKRLFQEAGLRLWARRDGGPIDTFDALARFAHTRAAFVAQKKLYGYLKARMGTRYPTMFEDDVFVASINIAKWHVFAACLSDITVHAVARVVAAGGLSPEEGRELATRCYEAGLAANGDGVPEEAMPDAWRAAFATRLARVHWDNLAAGGDAITECPAALYHWAPIDDRLKRHDQEIVENSIRFAWAEFTREFRKRAVLAAIAAEFRTAAG
jgi:hypothetical protein